MEPGRDVKIVPVGETAAILPALERGVVDAAMLTTPSRLFDEVYVTTKGGPQHSSTVVVYYLYQQAFQFFHAGYAAAIAVVLFAAIALITVVQLG